MGVRVIVVGIYPIGIAVDQGDDWLAPGGIVANVERKVGDKAHSRSPTRVYREFRSFLAQFGSLGVKIFNKFSNLHHNSL